MPKRYTLLQISGNRALNLVWLSHPANALHSSLFIIHYSFLIFNSSPRDAFKKKIPLCKNKEGCVKLLKV
jgi:hypothetical protein